MIPILGVMCSTQGLGEELALYFAARGARLILSSRKAEQLQVGYKAVSARHLS